MKINLKIDNKTKWNTRDLKKVFIVCMKAEGAHRCDVKVTTSKAQSSPIRGRAWLRSYYLKMYLPKVENNFNIIDKGYIEKLAQVFCHELHHNLGLYHNEMKDWWDIKVDYVKDMIVGSQQKKEKPKENIKLKRYEKALAKVKSFETKLKRTKTILKKWKNKVGYYEKAYSYSSKENKENR